MNRDNTKPFVIALLVVQAAISASLWVLNSVSIDSTAAFALLLAADVLLFAGICHAYFFSDTEAADGAVSGASAEPKQVQAQATPPVPSQPLFDMPPVTSRRLRIAVPVFSVLTLISLAALVASGQGTTPVFIPVFLTMVVVYVLASIYLFKMIIEKEKESTGQLAVSDQAGRRGNQSSRVVLLKPAFKN